MSDATLRMIRISWERAEVDAIKQAYKQGFHHYTPIAWKYGRAGLQAVKA
jgi:hypothetical protein